MYYMWPCTHLQHFTVRRLGYCHDFGCIDAACRRPRSYKISLQGHAYIWLPAEISRERMLQIPMLMRRFQRECLSGPLGVPAADIGLSVSCSFCLSVPLSRNTRCFSSGSCADGDCPSSIGPDKLCDAPSAPLGSMSSTEVCSADRACRDSRLLRGVCKSS